MKRRKKIRKEVVVAVRIDTPMVSRVDKAIEKKQVKSRSHIMRIATEDYLNKEGF
jgi:metal-responsive CopG/Arc/MetJ family transcriptional regulator